MKKKFLLPKYERDLIASGQFERIVGIDEAGRGCLAGPVAIGAFLFDLDHLDLKGINDSKQIIRKNRIKFFNALSSYNHKILMPDNSQIDSFGIARVIEKAISELIETFYSPKTLFLIDGKFKKDFGENTIKIIKGDATYYSIAAASILAKESRDRLMEALHPQYPLFNFNNNKGYGTKRHVEAIKTHGYCDIHRKTFKLKIFQQLNLLGN